MVTWSLIEIQTIKPFIVPEMTFKGHLRSAAMSSFVTSPGLFIRDRGSRLYLFQTEIAEMTLKVGQGH